MRFVAMERDRRELEARIQYLGNRAKVVTDEGLQVFLAFVLPKYQISVAHALCVSSDQANPRHKQREVGCCDHGGK